MLVERVIFARPRCDSSRLQVLECEAKYNGQILARDQPWTVNRKVHIRAVVAIKKRTCCQSPLFIEQPNAAIRADGAAPDLPHYPSGDGVVSSVVARMNDRHRTPPGTYKI